MEHIGYMLRAITKTQSRYIDNFIDVVALEAAMMATSSDLEILLLIWITFNPSMDK